MMRTGDRLGPYEILAPLGAGGMGEVYRAKDARLNREVAVKVLAESLSGDPAAMARFEREAKAVAALNHPSILSIFDYGLEGDLTYAVMELLEGETLQKRLDQGPLPVSKAVEIAGRIAQGLAAAHEKGIIHRDLKPANVFLTKGGLVKILDFGLARIQVPLEEAKTEKGAPGGTVPGTVMGTVGYMAPEQVRGEAVDMRTDLFTFGVVLYEMLAGKRPFERSSAMDTLAAILNEDPPPLPPITPPALDRAVRHCLEKEPEARFQSARDIAFDLEGITRPSSAAAQAPTAPGGSRRARSWCLASVTGITAVLGVAGGYWLGRSPTAEISFRQMSFRPQAIFQAAFAPDGETIVYSAALNGNVPELFTIRPEYPEPRPLGLPRTHLLSISSKGELAVLTNARFIVHRLFAGTLARVSLGDTAPREILEDVRQADWSPDGSGLAIVRIAKGKDRLEFPIGEVLYETAGYLSDLRVSPRGDRIALFEHPAPWDDRGSVIVVDRAGKRTVLSGDYWGEEGLSWSQTGDEVLFTASTEGSAQTLFGVDLSGHRRVALTSAGGLTMHDVSSSGRWLVTRDDIHDELSVLAPAASSERNLSWLDHSGGPHLSRDGHTLLFVEQAATAGPNYSVCLRKTDGGPVVRLGEGRPWGLSPDVRQAIAIIATPPQLIIYPTGPGETLRLPRGDLETLQSAGWFPDGKSVLVCGSEAGKASRCYAQDVSGGPPRPVTPEATANCMVSPDGRSILYSKAGETWFIQDAEGGAAEPVPGLTQDDLVIRWSADGRSVFAFRDTNVPFRFERLDLASGRRELIREVAPADRTGVLNSWGAAFSDDTRAYAYCYQRMTSHLFVVEGAQ